MTSELLIGSDPVYWLDGAFPLPRPDISGNCNFHYTARFMESSETECVHSVPNLKSACSKMLNPAYFRTNLKVIENNQKLDISIGDVYSLDVS